MLYMRNKQTGEIKAAEADTPEYHALQEVRGPDGRPLWEQTGAHHATEVVERAEAGELREQDMGAEDQPVPDVTSTVGGPDPAPWKRLTAAEREMGLTDEKKAEHLAQGAQGLEAREGSFASATEKISGSDNPQKGSAVPSADELDGLTRAELKQRADELGVEVPSNAKKDEIKAALAEQQTSTPEAAV